MSGKRHHGEGNLQKNGKGYRLVKVVQNQKLVGPTVKPETTPRLTRQSAERAWEAKHNQQIKPSSTISLRELIAARQQRKADPLAGYFYNKYLLRTALGKTLVPDLKPKHIENLVTQLKADGKAPSSINRYLGVLVTELNRAVRDGIITTNPAIGFKQRIPPQQFKRVLSADERKAFLALGWPEWFRVGLLLMLHGLRGQEARRLTYKDWDGNGITIRETKTGVDRWVPVTHPDLVAVLNSGVAGPVWRNGEGRAVTKTMQRSAWDTVIKGHRVGKGRGRTPAKHAFTDMTPHDLRSTAAMMLLENGVDVRTASELLGHSPQMLLDIYSRSRKSLKEEAMQKIWNIDRS